MTNYKLLTGCFAGEIVAEGQLLDIDFDLMDGDLQDRIYQFKSEKGIKSTASAIEEYENSWDDQETDEEVTLKPLSEW